MAAGEGTPCLACGARAVRPNRRGSLACENCGLEAVPVAEIDAGGPVGHRSPCPWCPDGHTVLASTTGHTRRGHWEVYQCDRCGAQYAAYVRSGSSRGSGAAGVPGD